MWLHNTDWDIRNFLPWLQKFGIQPLRLKCQSLGNYGHLPSVYWHCWLMVRKSIQPVKIDWQGIGVVICLERGADCLHMVQLMPLLPKTLSSLASFKYRLVLPFLYWLTWVVLEKRPLNGFSSSSSCCCCLVIVSSCQWLHLTGKSSVVAPQPLSSYKLLK